MASHVLCLSLLMGWRKEAIYGQVCVVGHVLTLAHNNQEKATFTFTDCSIHFLILTESTPNRWSVPNTPLFTTVGSADHKVQQGETSHYQLRAELASQSLKEMAMGLIQ